MPLRRSAVGYLLGRLVIGRLRALRKHPSQIVFLVILVAFITTILILTSQDAGQDIGWLDVPTRTALLSLACAAFMYLAVRTGLKTGSTFYRLADVNLLFPSPVSQRSVLIYGFARQLGIAALVLVWLSFQTINLQGLFAIRGAGFIPFAAGAFLLTCYMPVISMLIYGRLLRKPSRRVRLQRAVTVVPAAVGLLSLVATVRTGDVVRALQVVFAHPAIRYIPLIGWIRTLLSASYLGWDAYTWISLLLAAAGLFVLIRHMLTSDLDFYEDVLLVTEKREATIERKKQGQSPFQATSGKTRRIKSHAYHGYGASALFYRQLLEYRKTGFLLFDKSTLVVVFAAIVAGYLLRDNPMGMDFLLYISLYLLFFLSIAGKWDQELTKPYIFLLPAAPLSKIWYATAAVHLKHLVEGLILFGIAGWYFGEHLVTRLLSALAYVGFGGLYVYTTILFYRWIGRLKDTIVMRVLVFLLILTVCSPAITLLVLGGTRLGDALGMQWLLLLGVLLYCSLIALLAMLAGRRLFTSMENAAI